MMKSKWSVQFDRIMDKSQVDSVIIIVNVHEEEIVAGTSRQFDPCLRLHGGSDQLVYDDD